MKPTPELINDWHEKARQMALQADGYFDDVEHWRHFAELAASWGAAQAQQTTEPELPDDEPSDAEWDKVDPAFTEWWNAEYDDTTNPFRIDSLAYWAWAGWKAAGVRVGMAQSQDALGYAQRLAKSIASKEYPEVTQFEVLGDLMGVLSQIDNMTCGMTRVLQGGQQP